MQRFVVGSAFTRLRLALSLKVQHSPVMSVFSNASHSSTRASSTVSKFASKFASKSASIGAPYAARIKFDFAVWEDFKHHNGRIQYYFYGKMLGHGGVRFRIPNSDTTAQAELLVGTFRGEKKWFVCVKKIKTTEWKPTSEGDVEVSKYDWHVGAMLHMVHRFSQDEFQDYHVLSRSCNHWKRKVVRYMRENGPPDDYIIPSNLDDLIRQLLNKEVDLDIVHH